MKKFFWISFLLGLIFLWGCTTMNKLSQDELFQKKQECLSNKNIVDKDNERLNENGIDCTIDEIFYSKSLNTCISVISCLMPIDDNNVGIFYMIGDISKQKNFWRIC